jgi:transcriptional regulator with XRE-family HTH domain
MDYQDYRCLPNALRKHRKAAGLSQQVLAKLIGVDPSWLSRWENGDTLPNLVSAIHLSILFGVPVNELFGDLVEVIREEVARGKL